MYTLQFTEPAEEDLLSTLRYISDVLKAPEAAKNLLDEIEEQTQILKTSPLCYALVLDDYLCSKGIRSFLVKNYQLFYVIDEEEKIVSIIRILYARRDWSYLLRNDNS
jgi:plasmid stabilization system protein ParE